MCGSEDGKLRQYDNKMVTDQLQIALMRIE